MRKTSRNRLQLYRLKIIGMVFLTLAAFLCIMYSVVLPDIWTAKNVSIMAPAIIMDAGHGGQDGGAVSPGGISEQAINLSISRKAYYIANFCGIPAIMTRYDESSLNFNPKQSIKKNKINDTRARVEIAKQYPKSDFISIHQNKFTDTKYFGAQTFHRNDQNSLVLAQQVQGALYLLDNRNKRVFKRVPNQNYIMENIKNTGIIIECGFLSNPEEALKLQDELYHTKLAILIIGGYTNYKYNR